MKQHEAKTQKDGDEQNVQKRLNGNYVLYGTS